jgi:hypothetical protein
MSLQKAPASEGPRRRLSALDQAVYALLLLGLASVFGLAAWLKPDASGLGTHTELGLPPCGFYVVFHKPCPSCGMTTAFAWMMHGHPLKALKTQPAGVAVFLAAAFLLFYLPWAWWRGRPPVQILETRGFLPVVLSLIAIILVVWGMRVLY